MAHQPRKRFGQHFLVDQFIIERLIDLISPSEGKHFIEIGPGQGVLTQQLLARGARVSAIEIDRDLVALLEKKYGNNPKFSVLSADVMKTDITSLVENEKVCVVGNLPYNISTPLLNHLFLQLDSVVEMNFMLQKEVVARMCALPGSGDYGRLSVHTQTHCRTAEILHVPPTAFSPPPKVDSAVVNLIPHEHQLSKPHRLALANLTQHAFAQRRKMIKSSLSKVCSQEDLMKHGIDPTSRPDLVSVDTFVSLAKHLATRDHEH